MSDINFICPTCKRPTQPTDNEIINHLAKEIDRYVEVLIERTKELDRTRKELEQSEICCTEWEKQALDYKAENIALSGDLECTRKALELATERLQQIAHESFQGDQQSINMGFHIRAAAALTDIEQITALEHKDVK